jgi:hypothetical protein
MSIAMMTSRGGNGKWRRGKATASGQTVESAVRSARAAMLTDAQFAKLMQLRDAYDAARSAGDATESARLEALILALVREGPARLA